MDRAKFFAALRSSLFKSGLSQPQVEGIEAILASCQKHGVSDAHHVANIMAQVYHETGGYMSPIKETVYASHKNKNPSDATVIARLNSAFAKGQLSWVKTPYWRDGWFGRGMVQITHKSNYEKLGRRLGVDLVANRDLTLRTDISADIAVVGMSEGMFTGKRLSGYTFPAALNAAPANNPRRIINGVDGTDAKVAGYHRAFHKALIDAGFVAYVVPSPVPVPVPAIRPTLRMGAKGEDVRELQRLLGVSVDGQFGPATNRAVLTFQGARGLKQDGIVGPATWAALSAPQQPQAASTTDVATAGVTGAFLLAVLGAAAYFLGD